MNEGHAVAKPGRRPAVVLVAHGAERSQGAGASLRRLAEKLRQRTDLAAVEIAFVHGEPALTAVLDRLCATPELCVIPMFAAEGYHTRRIIRAAVETAGATRPWCVIRQATALGVDPAYTDSLAQRVHALVRQAGIETSDASFFAIGHGSRGATMAPDDAANRLAHALRSRFAISAALYLDGAPAAVSWKMRFATPEVVVAPVFFSDGHHARVDVPHLFGRPESTPAPADAIDGPWMHDGQRLWFVALPPTSVGVADIIVERARGDHRMLPSSSARDASVVGRSA